MTLYGVVPVAPVAPVAAVPVGPVVVAPLAPVVVVPVAPVTDETAPTQIARTATSSDWWFGFLSSISHDVPSTAWLAKSLRGRPSPSSWPFTSSSEPDPSVAPAVVAPGPPDTPAAPGAVAPVAPGAVAPVVPDDPVAPAPVPPVAPGSPVAPVAPVAASVTKKPPPTTDWPGSHVAVPEET